MTWLARDNRGHAHPSRIAKGAVPLGQHSHHPDTVMPLPEAPPAPVELAAVREGVYIDLPQPAPRALGCRTCAAPAALIDPATGAGYCADCWITQVVQAQLD